MFFVRGNWPSCILWESQQAKKIDQKIILKESHLLIKIYLKSKITTHSNQTIWWLRRYWWQIKNWNIESMGLVLCEYQIKHSRGVLGKKGWAFLKSEI